MRTVLGLSKTSTSIGWVLVDDCNVAGDLLDHDAFDIADASTVAPVATARRVRDIATASGYTVDSVRVTSSGNLSSLREALTQAGFPDVMTVSLTGSIRAWAMDLGRANDQRTIAVCILGQDSASLSVIDTATGTMESVTTTASRDCVALSVWLNASFGLDGSQPEALYLIGSRSQLATLADKLDMTLSIPVVATHDAQLALARGAVTSSIWQVNRCVGAKRSGFASQARTLTAVAAVAVISLFALSSAGSPVTLAQRSAVLPAAPAAARPAEIPPAAAPPAPPEVFPPAPAAEPMPEAPAPLATFPEPSAVPAVQVAPPVEHLPDVQSLEHIPDPQGALAPGPIAPGPAIQDPSAAELTPVLGDLP